MKEAKRVMLFAAMLITTITVNAQWVQIGNNIEGEASGDNSGESVSLSADGSVVAIGAPWNSGGSGDFSGHVRVYKNNSGLWTQIGSDIDGEAAYDGSGESVSLSADGSVVAIGAITNEFSTGQVRVYENNSGVWTQIGSDIEGDTSLNYLGRSVSLSADGSIVAIGADGYDDFTGRVKVYENNSGVWTQLGSDIKGEALGDNSGGSVSLSADGSVVAIGARINAGNGNASGHVRVYENNSGVWTQVGSDIDGETAFNTSGGSVSLSADGSVVAIGAIGTNVNGFDDGQVRVFKNNSGVWTQVGNDIEGDAAFDYLGRSVSLSDDGSILAIGADGHDANGDEAGIVRVYENNSGVWIQIGSDIEGEAPGDRSGTSVSLNADGSMVAIGADFNAGNGNGSGHVKIYSNAGLIGIDELDQTSIRIYPNPTENNFIIEGEDIYSVKIVDIIGKVILQKIIIDSEITIDLKNETKGVYFVSVKTNKGISTKTIVLE